MRRVALGLTTPMTLTVLASPAAALASVERQTTVTGVASPNRAATSRCLLFAPCPEDLG
jgi:hypothetical protein